MKVRLIRDYLLHRSGDVLNLGVGDARRLLNVRLAVPYVEADDPPPQEPEMKEEETKETVPPNDKMVRTSTTKKRGRGRPKGSKNKKRKKRPAV